MKQSQFLSSKDKQDGITCFIEEKKLAIIKQRLSFPKARQAPLQNCESWPALLGKASLKPEVSLTTLPQQTHNLRPKHKTVNGEISDDTNTSRGGKILNSEGSSFFNSGGNKGCLLKEHI